MCNFISLNASIQSLGFRPEVRKQAHSSNENVSLLGPREAIPIALAFPSPGLDLTLRVRTVLAMRAHADFRRNAGGQHNAQHGYILLTLMLFVALMALAATAVVPRITFEMRRDQEEEMIHRGVQYSRAVRLYFKKFGRFPKRIEELEKTNNVRLLRKRYKDPITGQDFKILHLSDVKLSSAPATLANIERSANPDAASPLTTNSPVAPNSAQAVGGDAPDQETFGNPASPSPARVFSGPAFGGEPIVGVVSISEKQSIREFNKKNHYNQWLFIYDPGSDRGGLLNTPAQPPLQNVTGREQSAVPGAPGGTQAVPDQTPPQVQPAPP